MAWLRRLHNYIDGHEGSHRCPRRRGNDESEVRKKEGDSGGGESGSGSGGSRDDDDEHKDEDEDDDGLDSEWAGPQRLRQGRRQ